ncbi:MAG: hypothetical protein ACK4UJ_07685 [Leptonema sp. (in: bacteria)]
MVFKHPKTEIVGSQYSISKNWFYISILSLAFSGLLAFFISIARIPIIHNHFSDPTFFKKGLIVHVNFGFLIWLSSFGMAIYSLLIKDSRRTLSFFISLMGIAILAFSWLFIDGEVILSNYIPMIDHPLFFLGIFLFTTGIFLSFFDANALFTTNHNRLPNISITFIKIFAIAYIIAYELGILAFFTTPNDFPPKEYYEILFWGSGHIFVFSIEALKISLWFAVLYSVFKKEFKFKIFLKIIAIAYLMIPLSSLLVTQYDPYSSPYRSYFTEIMKWGIFPFVSIIIVYIFFETIQYLKVIKINNKVQSIQLLSLYLSIFMTIFGFILGSLIRGSNTMIPAHYHASIGAVTLTLMSFTILLFEYYNLNIQKVFNKYKIYTYQPILYAIGQTIFATGFALASINGQGRKLYGNEQQVKGLLDYIGLSLVGIGGILAIVAGILFILLTLTLIVPELKKLIIKKPNLLQYFYKISKYKEIHYGKTSNPEIHG